MKYKRFGKTGFVLRAGQWAIFKVSGQRDLGIMVAGHAYFLCDIIPYRVRSAVKRALQSIRYCFPYFFTIGLHDCDTGRVHHWYRAWALNGWRAEALCSAADKASDGPAYIREISAFEYLRTKLLT